MKELNLAQFFRYFAPGSIGMIYYLFLRYNEYKELRLGEIDLGEGAVLIFGAAVLGHIFATIYHAIINLRCEWIQTNLRPDHRDFFVSMTETAKLFLVYLPSSLAVEKPSQEMMFPATTSDKSIQVAKLLSSQGAAMLFDSTFYLMREREMVRMKSKNDLSRFESFFHLLHGVGATIVGIVLTTILWLIHARLRGCDFDCVRWWIWLVPIFACALLSRNWYMLRRMAMAYVEGWYLDAISRRSPKENMIYVRPWHLNPGVHVVP